MKRNIFHQPFPLNDWLWFRQRGIGFGLFIFLFLLLFKPFSLHLYNNTQLLYTALLYGSITSLVILGSGYLFVNMITPRISEESWTLGKQIIFNVLLMICIALANIFIMQAVHNILLPLWWYFLMLKWVIMLGVIPIAISELVSYNRYLHRHLENARLISDMLDDVKAENNQNAIRTATVSTERETNTKENDPVIGSLFRSSVNEVIVTGENNGDRLVLPGDKLLAVQALDNYVNIFWEEHHTLQTTLIRNTLTHVAEQLKDVPCIYKTHRGWLVNTNRVSKVEGNAQSLKLQVDLLSQPVPVSRSNISGYRQLCSRRSKRRSQVRQEPAVAAS